MEVYSALKRTDFHFSFDIRLCNYHFKNSTCVSSYLLKTDIGNHNFSLLQLPLVPGLNTLWTGSRLCDVILIILYSKSAMRHSSGLVNLFCILLKHLCTTCILYF